MKTSKNLPKHIVVSGGIGVGKTTITRKLSKLLPSVQHFEENVNENPYLSRFYENMNRWGFHSRIAYLTLKAEAYRNIDSESKYVVMDRCVHELIVFAQIQHDLGNLVGVDYDIYWSLYQTLVYFCRMPDYVIYAYCNVETSLQRIHTRSRPFELNIERHYLEKVNKYYEDWLGTLNGINIYRINTDDPRIVEKQLHELSNELNMPTN